MNLIRHEFNSTHFCHAGGDSFVLRASGQRGQVVLRRDHPDRRPQERGYRLQHGNSGSGRDGLRPEEEVRRQERKGKLFFLFNITKINC